MKEIKVILGDCMEVMAQYPEKYFDLAVVDPPYGIGVNKMTLGNGNKKINRGINDWDKESPSQNYFKNVINCANSQIIWGANHFISKIPYDSSCWIFWDKGTGSNDFADGELAWTSFDGTVRKYFKSWVGANAKDECLRIHPTQKPVALYDWIYQKYLPEGGKVLDTHGGSMSNVISWIKAGNIDGVCVEIDKDYFSDAKKRIQNFLAQQDMFRNEVKIEFIE